jgi:ADP-heptose:LPS heptosyltransferase
MRLKPIERRSKRRLSDLAARLLPSRPFHPAAFDPASVRTVLVVRPHNERGDMLLMVPLLRALRESIPAAGITLLASAVTEGVMRGNPYVDRLLVLDAGGLRRRPWQAVSLVFALRRPRPDLVLVPSTVSWSVTSALLARWSGGRVRVGTASDGFGHEFSRFAFNVVVPHPGEDLHESLRNLAVLEPFGIGTDDLSPTFRPSEEEEAFADAFLREWKAVRAPAPFALMHVGAGKLPNRWPAERFGVLAARCAGEGTGEPLFMAGPGEEGILETARASYRRETGREAAVLHGRSLGELAALAKRARVYVGNDTGPLHLAAAVGARTLALLGPTDPARWLPLTPKTRAVCAPGGALDRLPVEDVWEALCALLQAPARERLVRREETR